jgi:HAD superfamily hydrolase (TIGR01509 family)
MFDHDPQDVAVLFDLDGTLVDSQDAETWALQRLAEQLGGRVSTEKVADLAAGRQMQEAIDMLCAHIEVTPPVNALPRTRRIAEELLDGRLRCVPGVDDALTRIDYRKYVVSNSPVDMIRDRLSHTNLLKHFPGQHFSAYEYQTWKPEPDLYLAAMRDLGIDPGGAIAVEDSRVGVEAAVAAGLRVYWYQPNSDAEGCWVGAVRVFGHMSLLPAMLEEDLSSVRSVVHC